MVRGLAKFQAPQTLRRRPQNVLRSEKSAQAFESAATGHVSLRKRCYWSLSARKKAAREKRCYRSLRAPKTPLQVVQCSDKRCYGSPSASKYRSGYISQWSETATMGHSALRKHCSKSLVELTVQTSWSSLHLAPIHCTQLHLAPCMDMYVFTEVYVYIHVYIHMEGQGCLPDGLSLLRNWRGVWGRCAGIQIESWPFVGILASSSLGERANSWNVQS